MTSEPEELRSLSSYLHFSTLTKSDMDGADKKFITIKALPDNEKFFIVGFGVTASSESLTHATEKFLESLSEEVGEPNNRSSDKLNKTSYNKVEKRLQEKVDSKPDEVEDFIKEAQQ